MLQIAIACLVIAMIAALLGFGGTCRLLHWSRKNSVHRVPRDRGGVPPGWRLWTALFFAARKPWGSTRVLCVAEQA